MDGIILVGVDASGPSRAALRWSIERAHSTGMRLMITHVVEPGHDIESTLSAGARYDAALGFVRAEASYATLREPSISVSYQVLEGDPLIELAEASTGATMLVLGTHKTGFIHGKSFGSRFLSLAAAAHSPVAFIPDLIGPSRRGIVAPADDSPVGRRVVLFAAAEAAKSSQVLTLVQSRRAEDPDAAQALIGLIALAKHENPRLGVRSRYGLKSLAESLVDASTTASMLVIDHSRNYVGGTAVLGSITHDVLLNIACPTIIVAGDVSPNEKLESADTSRVGAGWVASAA